MRVGVLAVGTEHLIRRTGSIYSINALCKLQPWSVGHVYDCIKYTGYHMFKYTACYVLQTIVWSILQLRPKLHNVGLPKHPHPLLPLAPNTLHARVDRRLRNQLAILRPSILQRRTNVPK